MKRNLRGLGDNILVLDNHVSCSVDLVVKDDDFAFHQLQANIAYRTRVILQHQVHLVVVKPRANCRKVTTQLAAATLFGHF